MTAAAGDPAGLVVRDDLPEVGSAGLNLLTRRGLDIDLELTALGAAEAFFARHGQLLHVAGR